MNFFKFFLNCTILILLTHSLTANATEKMSGSNKRKVIYDTDLAMDDWFALLYLLKAQRLDIIGVTVPGSGEAHCSFVEPVVSELMEISETDQDIPVHCGATEPLDGYFTFPYDWRKGANTLNGLISYDDITYEEKLKEKYNTWESADFIIEQLEKHEAVEIIAVGPLSNVAMAIKKRPDLLHKISRVWIMGGNVFVPGNIGSNPYPSIDHLLNQTAEWNIWTDIMAAEIVFESGLDIALIPLDATNSVPISQEYVDRYKKEAGEKDSLAGGFVAWNFNLPFIKIWLEEDRFYFWDTLAAGVAMDTSMCAEWQEIRLKVNDQKTRQFYIYTDDLKPNFSDLNFLGMNREHYHPLVAGAIVEDEGSQPINVCMKGSKVQFFDDFLTETLK